ncbi:MAG: hypothetical protein IJC80_03835 [Clostridia bacterium]|nr:hypothetical protein [Clostridia bacterium]
MSDKASDTQIRADIDAQNDNFDTSSAKNKIFAPESNTNSPKSAQENLESNKKPHENAINSCASESLEAINAKNSNNYTNNQDKIDKIDGNQSSDTSTNIPDPLSVITPDERPNNQLSQEVSSDEILVFNKLFPSVCAEKLKEDKLFCLFSSHNGKNLTISDLYTNYLQLINLLDEDFTKKSLVSLQNKLSSPGSLASSEKSSEIFFTKEQVLKMSHGQISQNYDIIRKSQQKW